MIEFERKYGFGNTPEGFDSGGMRLFEFAPRQTGKLGGMMLFLCRDLRTAHFTARAASGCIRVETCVGRECPAG